jgi:hypothetical protein
MGTDDGSGSIFEWLYKAFMRQGGFSQPCVTEEIERAYRDMDRRPPKVCPHGLTQLTCGKCYFDDGA